MFSYKHTIEQKKCFNKNIKYMINQIESNLNDIENLENELYLEISKKQVAENLKKVLSMIKKWPEYFTTTNNINSIQQEYKKVESDISELELCLADYDDIFHLDGISYALYQIGKLLINILNTKDSKYNDR